MIALRHFNPFYTIRLEREVAAIPGMKRGIKSLVESIGRQAPIGSETDLRGRLAEAEVELDELRTGLHLIGRLMASGRAAMAAQEVMRLVAREIDQREAG